MKNKIQESSGAKIVEVEKIFIASFDDADVIFIKAINQDSIALKLPDNFLQVLKSKIEPQN